MSTVTGQLAQAPTAVPYAIKAMDSAAFLKARFPKDWLIEDVLVRGQAGVIGGPKKTLKTSIMADMAISIGTGRPFLGEFRVRQPHSVAVFSGETGGASLQDLAVRICAARRISLGDCRVHWCLHLPSLSHKPHLDALGSFLNGNKIEVLFVDPLYLCLLNGGRSESASNLYAIGPILQQAVETCLDAGTTPIFVHHATKSSARTTGSAVSGPDLDDLAFAGVGEFVRQWVLLKRKDAYQPGSGRHELVMSYGGSAGHSGNAELVVEEGSMDNKFEGRGWKVAVATFGEKDTKKVSARDRQQSSAVATGRKARATVASIDSNRLTKWAESQFTSIE